MSEEKEYKNSPAKRAANMRYYYANKQKCIQAIYNWRDANPGYAAEVQRRYRQRKKEIQIQQELEYQHQTQNLFKEMPFPRVIKLTTVI